MQLKKKQEILQGSLSLVMQVFIAPHYVQNPCRILGSVLGKTVANHMKYKQA